MWVVVGHQAIHGCNRQSEDRVNLIYICPLALSCLYLCLSACFVFHISRNWKTVQNECVTWKHKYQHLNHQKQQLQSSEQISLQGKRRVESSLQQMSKSFANHS